jgi:anti-anti-sigma regulatory factor
MLRISIKTNDLSTTVTLEGRVVGAWVDELSASWRRLLESASRPIRIDLDGVTFVDAAGKAVLRGMHADGAVLTANTIMMQALVDDVVASRDRSNP